MSRSEKIAVFSLAAGAVLAGLLCYWGASWWFGGIIGLLLAGKLFDSMIKTKAAIVITDSKLDSAQPVVITAPKPEKTEA